MSDAVNDSTPGSSGRPAQWTPPTVEEIARLFPNFDGFEMIGYGGMGAVYKARQMALDRDVAIKLLPLEVSADASFAERFAREARAMGKLSHPNIVAVHDFGQTAEGHLFIVMDFVEGVTLHQLIHHHGVMPDDALSIIEQVCDALDYAHGRGIVHRDIKPANVLVGRDGVAKVADFGLASVADGNTQDDGRPQVTMTGMVMGTPDYMAPEQRHGMGVDHRADIYSLGVILYESLVGEVPRGVFDPPSHRVKVDKRLDAVVIHAMQQQADRRFQHTREMRAAITAIRKGPAPTPSPALSPASEIAPTKSRAPLYAIAAVIVAAVIVAVAMLREKPPVLTAAEKAAAEAKTKPVPTPEPAPKRDVVEPEPAPSPAIVETEPPKPPEPEPQTPRGSAPTGVQQFGGHRYQFVAAPGISWLEAKRKAEETGGHLVAITSRDENDWITNTFMAGLDSGVLWIGATNSGPDGKWTWVTGEPVEFANWTPAAKRATAADQAAGIGRGTAVQYSMWGNWPAAMDKWDGILGFIVEWSGDTNSAMTGDLVNLLTQIDIARDTVEGNWSMEGGELVRGEGEGPMRIALPAQPPEEYDFQLVFTQKVRSDLITVMLPWGTQAVQWTMNHDGVFAFEMVNGAALGPNNPSYRKRDTLPLNQRHAVLLQVRREGIKAFVNGEMISELKAPAETKIHWVWPMKDPRSLGLGAFPPTTFHSIELRHSAPPAKSEIAQEKPMTPAPEPPKPAAPPASPEVVKWLGEQEAVFAAQWSKDAVAPFDAAVAKLRETYAAAVEKGIADSTKAAKLEDALAWRNEKARIAAQMPHEAEDAATDPVALKKLRAWWRVQFAKLDSDRFARAKLVHAKFDALLAQGQTGYTQRQRLDDALLLKTKRDEIREVWLAPPVDFSKPAPPKPPVGQDLSKPKPVASTGAGTITGRDAVVHLRSLGFYVGFTDADGVARLITHNNKVEDIPGGRIEITGLSTPGNRRVDGGTAPITDEDFAKLAPMKKLRSFEVKTTGVTGTGFAFLAGSPALEKVVLDGPDFTDAAIEPLLALRNIRVLTIISNVRIHLARFGDFASLPALEGLTFGGIPPGQDGPFASLAKARKLKSLALTDCPLSFDRAEAVAALPDLTDLFLTGKQGPALAKLEKLQKLTTLTLLNAPEAGAHLGFIGKLRKIETLTLDGAEAPGLAAAAGAPALRTITLGGGLGVSITTDDALKTIAASFPRLETLNIADYSKRDVTPAGIRLLAVLPKLKAFSWGKATLPLEIATAIAELPALEKFIAGDSGLTEVQLAEIAKSKTITHLDIAHNKLTPAAVEALKKMRGLRDLFVFECNLSTDDIAALRKALPRCNVRNG